MSRAKQNEKRFCWVVERYGYGKRGWVMWEVFGTEAGAKAGLRDKQREDPSFEFRIEKYWSARND